MAVLICAWQCISKSEKTLVTDMCRAHAWLSMGYAFTSFGFRLASVVLLWLFRASIAYGVHVLRWPRALWLKMICYVCFPSSLIIDDFIEIMNALRGE